MSEPVISGIGPNAPVITNDQGGKQSYFGRSFHLLPAKAITIAAEVLYKGAERYEEHGIENSLDANWRRMPQHDHVNHALSHLFAFLADDQQEIHLAHALCRIMFAIEMQK